MNSLSDRLRREAAEIPAKTSANKLSDRIVAALRDKSQPLEFPAATRPVPLGWLAAAALVAGISIAAWMLRDARPSIDHPRQVATPDFGFSLAGLSSAASAALKQPDPMEAEARRVQEDLARAGKFLMGRVPSL